MCIFKPRMHSRSRLCLRRRSGNIPAPERKPWPQLCDLLRSPGYVKARRTHAVQKKIRNLQKYSADFGFRYAGDPKSPSQRVRIKSIPASLTLNIGHYSPGILFPVVLVFMPVLPTFTILTENRKRFNIFYSILVIIFTINNMPVVSSQYWKQVHGFTPEDVRKDEEGLQIMRTLARNMAWLLKCIECGKANGIPLPEREPSISTNFIR